MNLTETLALHRALYRDELHIPRLVSRQPPTTMDRQSGELFVEPGAAVGMTISGRLLRYLGHPEGRGDTSWSKAWWQLRHRCRRDHPYHRGANLPYWRGSLCYQAVKFAVTREFSIADTAAILRYDDLEPVLREALRIMEEILDEGMAKAAQREQHDEGVFRVGETPGVHEHRALDGLHREECPQCRRNAA